MHRLSLNTVFTRISCGKFQYLVSQFRRASETAFGTGCDLEITVRPNTPYRSSCLHDWGEPLPDENITLKRTSIADIKPEIWKTANYVEVSIRPRYPDFAPASAWAHAEFLGYRPEQATFYIQGGDKTFEAMQTLRAANSFIIAGSGYDGNDREKFRMPAQGMLRDLHALVFN